MAHLLTGTTFRGFTDDGAPLVGGLLYTYVSGTTTPQPVYSDAALTTPRTNPVQLNARGEAEIWLDPTKVYTFHLTTSAGATVGYDVDDIQPPEGLYASTGSGQGASLLGTTSGRNVQQRLDDFVSVKDFGAVGNGSTDDTVAIQAAINIGGDIYFPAGLYKVSSTLAMKINTTLRGAGKRTSTMLFTGTGDGIKMSSPINSSTPVNTKIVDVGLVCTNLSNVGGAYVDVGGSMVFVEHCYFQGFKYGVIFDQTEIAAISRCVFNPQISAAIWLCNFADHTPSAQPYFTNRITIDNNQFNQTTGYCIVDDGGIIHSIIDNNFNGGIQAVRFAGAQPVVFSRNECEVATGPCISFQTTTLAGTATINCQAVEISSNTFLPTAGQYSVDVLQAASIVSMNNSYGSVFSSAPCIHIGTLFHFKGLGDRAGAAISGSASFMWNNDSSLNGVPITSAGEKFGNTGSASTGTVVNTILNNYEEGTFVPTITGTITAGAATYTTQVGTYTRIGNQVNYSISLIWSGHTGTGSMKAAGLPFAAKNVTGQTQPASVVFDGLVIGAGKQLGAGIVSGATQVSLYSLDVAGGALALLAIDAAGSLFVTGAYTV